MTAEQIWARFVALLERLPGLRGAAFEAEDRGLAEDIARAPGVLEAQLVGRIEELATRASPDASHKVLLGYLWNLWPPDAVMPKGFEDIFRRLPATFAALEPTAMLRAYAAARPYLARLDPIAANNCARLGHYFLVRAGLAALDGVALPPEHRDVLRAWVTRKPLPDVLPPEVAAWSAQRIEEALLDYTGLTREVLASRLQPGGYSTSGFLAPGESLGEVIRRDARALDALGVSRRALADRLAAVIAIGWNRGSQDPTDPLTRERRGRAQDVFGPPRGDGSYNTPLQCALTVFAGYQDDPFQSVMVTGSQPYGAAGCADFMIRNAQRGPQVVLRGSDLMPALIRRYGFFEGAVPHRLEPAHAAWVLGLIDIVPQR